MVEPEAIDSIVCPTITGGGTLAVIQPITNAEIVRGLTEGGYIRGVTVEAQDASSRSPQYAVYILTTWRAGYSIFHIAFPRRPRLFRDLDRLVELLRFEFQFQGAISLRLVGDSVGQRVGRLREQPRAQKPTTGQ